MASKQKKISWFMYNVHVISSDCVYIGTSSYLCAAVFTTDDGNLLAV